MYDAENRATRPRDTPTPRRPDRDSRDTVDGGFSLVEMLVSIVLLGLTVTAVLATMRVSVTASAVDRDHAIAFEWLQSASDQIYQDPRQPCHTVSAADAAIAYTASAQSVARPPAWDTTSASISVVDVEYLGKASPDDDFEWGAYCFEGTGYVDSPLYTQRVTVQVVSPEGNIIQTLEMVKSE